MKHQAAAQDDEFENEGGFYPKGPYSPRESGGDGRPYVSGPGAGTGYNSGTLYPGMRLSSYEDTKAAARIANHAFAQGVQHAQAEIWKALGLNPENVHRQLVRR